MKKSVSGISGPGDSYLSKFKPLQVEVRGSSRDDFEIAAKIFKALVNKEKVISLYKEKQQYEKPSVKKRRKRREAVEKRLAAESKQRMIESGEWDKRQKKKQQKFEKKLAENVAKKNSETNE
jgi:small subunit ribosomal protein S21